MRVAARSPIAPSANSVRRAGSTSALLDNAAAPATAPIAAIDTTPNASARARTVRLVLISTGTRGGVHVIAIAIALGTPAAISTDNAGSSWMGPTSLITPSLAKNATATVAINKIQARDVPQARNTRPTPMRLPDERAVKTDKCMYGIRQSIEPLRQGSTSAWFH